MYQSGPGAEPSMEGITWPIVWGNEPPSPEPHHGAVISPASQPEPSEVQREQRGYPAQRPRRHALSAKRREGASGARSGAVFQSSSTASWSNP
jgi:hypothetical protein